MSIDDLPSDQRSLNIVNQQKKVIHVLNLQSFICSFSYQNYVELYFLEDGKLKNVLLRLTFSSFYDQVSTCKMIIRCHRTRIVNLDYISSLVTNNGRKMVKLKYIDETIPVSRDYPIEDHFTGY